MLMPNTVSLQMWFQAEELPQGIEGINGLAEIWALQVHLKHPNVNTIARDFLQADWDWHNANKLTKSEFIR